MPYFVDLIAQRNIGQGMTTDNIILFHHSEGKPLFFIKSSFVAGSVGLSMANQNVIIPQGSPLIIICLNIIIMYSCTSAEACGPSVSLPISF